MPCAGSLLLVGSCSTSCAAAGAKAASCRMRNKGQAVGAATKKPLNEKSDGAQEALGLALEVPRQRNVNGLPRVGTTNKHSKSQWPVEGGGDGKPGDNGATFEVVQI
ncbi:hypothetical protein LX36DRAFT_172386 [Colletotrichum falcatum]|nr:hypothetical protein LX36DRAFT_172386 [Colletotrichum falcatum]